MTKIPHRFYRVGGDSRIAGFLLAAATIALLLIGTGPIAYIRECPFLVMSNPLLTLILLAVMVVGALIFVLGIDLVKEAVWDCRHKVTRCVFHREIHLRAWLIRCPLEWSSLPS